MLRLAMRYAALSAMTACTTQRMAAIADVGATPYSFAQIQTGVLLPSCAFASCHAGVGVRGAGGLDLTGDSYPNLIDAISSNEQAASAHMMRVAPCDAGASFLLIKLELPEGVDDPQMGYGAHMPSRNGSLPAATIDAVRAWILRGAPLNEADAKDCPS